MTYFIYLNCILLQRFKVLFTNSISLSNIVITDLKNDLEINGFDKHTHAFKLHQEIRINVLATFFPSYFKQVFACLPLKTLWSKLLSP